MTTRRQWAVFALFSWAIAAGAFVALAAGVPVALVAVGMWVLGAAFAAVAVSSE